MVIASSPSWSQATIFLSDAANIGAADVGGAAVAAGTGADVGAIVGLLVETVGACGCPSMIWVTGATIV